MIMSGQGRSGREWAGVDTSDQLLDDSCGGRDKNRHLIIDNEASLSVQTTGGTGQMKTIIMTPVAPVIVLSATGEGAELRVGADLRVRDNRPTRDEAEAEV